MTPSVPAVLELIAERIRDDVRPALGDGYGGQQMQRSLMLLQAVSEEFDRAAARRVEEIMAMQTLFAQAAAVVDDPELAQALHEAADARDDFTPAALSVSALDLRQHGLRALMIELQIWTEQHDTLQARAIGQALWRELRRSTERRQLSGARF